MWRRPVVIRIAAWVSAAAAVVFIVIMVNTGRRENAELVSQGAAVVKYIDTKGGAEVGIKRASNKSYAAVDIGTSEAGRAKVNIGEQNRQAARCNVEIIETNGDLKRIDTKAAWIIISVKQPRVAENGASRDEMDLLCLL